MQKSITYIPRLLVFYLQKSWLLPYTPIILIHNHCFEHFLYAYNKYNLDTRIHVHYTCVGVS